MRFPKAHKLINQIQMRSYEQGCQSVRKNMKNGPLGHPVKMKNRIPLGKIFSAVINIFFDKNFHSKDRKSKQKIIIYSEIIFIDFV